MFAARTTAALAAALALSACSGSDAPAKVLPTLSAPSATPTATALTVPAEAKAHTVFGAAAFVRFFFTELDKAYQAGTPFPLDGLADPQCESCKNFANVADHFATQKHRLAGPSFTSLTAESPPIEKGYAYVSLSFLAGPRTELDASGMTVKRYPDQGRLRFIVVAQLAPDGWTLRAMDKR